MWIFIRSCKLFYIAISINHDNDYYYKNELSSFGSGIINNEKYNIPSNTNNVLIRNFGKEWKTNYKITHIHKIDYYNSRLSITNISDFIMVFILNQLNLNYVQWILSISYISTILPWDGLLYQLFFCAIYSIISNVDG